MQQSTLLYDVNEFLSQSFTDQVHVFSINPGDPAVPNSTPVIVGVLSGVFLLLIVAAAVTLGIGIWLHFHRKKKKAPQSGKCMYKLILVYILYKLERYQLNCSTCFYTVANAAADFDVQMSTVVKKPGYYAEAYSTGKKQLQHAQ